LPITLFVWKYFLFTPLFTPTSYGTQLGRKTRAWSTLNFRSGPNYTTCRKRKLFWKWEYKKYVCQIDLHWNNLPNSTKHAFKTAIMTLRRSQSSRLRQRADGHYTLQLGVLPKVRNTKISGTCLSGARFAHA